MGRLSAGHVVVAVSPSSCGKTVVTSGAENAIKNCAAVMDCLYMDTARLQGIKYASKGTLKRFCGSTLTFVRFKPGLYHLLSKAGMLILLYRVELLIIGAENNRSCNDGMRAESWPQPGPNRRRIFKSDENGRLCNRMR